MRIGRSGNSEQDEDPRSTQNQTRETGGPIRAVRPLRLLTVVVVVIFAVEIAIMVVLRPLLVALPVVVSGLLDGILLILAVYPTLYLLVYRPLLRIIEERKRAEVAREFLLDGLRRANEDLVQANLRNRDIAQVAGRQAAELAGILDNMVDGVLACDAEGRVTLANEAGVRLLGLGSAEEIKQALAELPELLRMRHPGGEPIAHQELPLARALAGEVVALEDEIIFNPQTQQDVYLRTSAASIRDEGGKIVGAVEVVRDVTDLTELERLKDEFVIVASHEIKTPITAIKGFAQALLRIPGACAPRYHKVLQTMVRQSDRLDALMRDFVDASRAQLGQVDLSLRRVNLLALVREVVEQRASTDRDHRIVVSRKDAASVRGDPERLTRVLEGLLDNAVKFSPGGGEIEVQVRRDGERVVVSVTDHGVGIPADRQVHLFDRFYRAHIGTPYDYGGLGVGLYISREIVRRHGGEMWFESEEGNGSTFHFSLPLS